VRGLRNIRRGEAHVPVVDRRTLVRSGAAVTAAALAGTLVPSEADGATSYAVLGTDGTVGGPGGSPLANAVVTAAQGSDAPLSADGGTLVNIPAWQSGTAYPPGYVVQVGGVAYMAVSAFTSGASFGADGTSWSPLSSAELAYAQTTSAFTTSSTKLVNVPGLTLSVTTNGRPFMIRLVGEVQNSAVGGYGMLIVMNTTNSTYPVGHYVGLGGANEVLPVTLEGRQVLAPGTYNFQAQALSSSSGNAFKLSVTSPFFLQAVQV
jgi:hypothetical protein